MQFFLGCLQGFFFNLTLKCNAMMFMHYSHSAGIRARDSCKQVRIQGGGWQKGIAPPPFSLANSVPPEKKYAFQIQIQQE